MTLHAPYDDANIFAKMLRYEVPFIRVFEDDVALAFMDVFPQSEGHTLVIPKKEVDYIFDLDEKSLSGLMIFAQKVARKIEAAIDCKRVGVLVIGTEVPHAHIHLIPFQEESQMNIAAEKLKLPQEELAAIATQIRSKK